LIAGQKDVDFLVDLHSDGDIAALALALHVLGRVPANSPSNATSMPALVAEPLPASAEPVLHRGGNQSRPRVLVVDDDATIRAVTTEMLDICGYRPETVASAAAALAWYDQAPPDPDLLLIDLSMPGMSGPELVDRLGDRVRGTVVVYMTGYLDPDEAVELQSRHHAKILNKPFTIRDLASVLAHARLGDDGGQP
jgi:CheY-like chemotaxis protein